MDQCIVHCDAVRRGAPDTFVIGDMPFMSYQTSDEDAALVVEDALAVQEAGAHMLLAETVPPEVTEYITQLLNIPVFSIGAGKECDGQLLIVSDLIGQFPEEKHCYHMIDGERVRFLNYMSKQEGSKND